MAELNNSNEDPQVLPPKRKQTLDEDESTKKLRPDTEPTATVEHKPTNENDNKNETENEEEEEEEDHEAEDELDSDDEDEDEDEDEHSEIDRKGKGIMKDDKGKGKMIEEPEDDSDEDGGGTESDGDDDFSDDPLAEVDLDNILPSRTRRRTASRGVQISGEEVGDDKSNDA